MLASSCIEGCHLGQVPGEIAVRDLEFILAGVKDKKSRVRDPRADWIHVPDEEGEPWGMNAIEWSTGQVEKFRAARDALISSIEQVSGRSTGEINRQLIEANARPPLPPSGTVQSFIDTTTNLLAVYRQEVGLRKPKKALIVGLGLGALALIGTAVAVRYRTHG